MFYLSGIQPTQANEPTKLCIFYHDSNHAISSWCILYKNFFSLPDCFCLCLGFSLQITRNTPLLLTKRQLLHRNLNEVLTL